MNNKKIGTKLEGEKKSRMLQAFQREKRVTLWMVQGQRLPQTAFPLKALKTKTALSFPFR